MHTFRAWYRSIKPSFTHIHNCFSYCLGNVLKYIHLTLTTSPTQAQDLSSFA